jgi:hypothetical protein
MAQTPRIETLRPVEGDEPAQALVGTQQRQRFRDSLRDAFEGIDVEELQGGPEAPAVPPAAAVVTPPVAWSPTRAMAPLPGGTSALDPLPAYIRMELEAALAPLQVELSALRSEVSALKTLPDELSRVRRADMLALAGLLVVAFAAAAVVVAVILRG